MKVSSSSDRLTRICSQLALAIIIVIPFHALLTVWLSSLLGHYTLLRLWKEILLVFIGIGAGYRLFKNKQLRLRLWHETLTRLIIDYIGLQVIWGIGALLLSKVTAKAVLYGWIVDIRFLLFFLAVWVLAAETTLLKQYWKRSVIWPALLVIIFGLVQYFLLPYDVLKHLGYGAATIFPYETINHNTAYIRVMSTLRGANPLGAYLVLILSILAVLLRKKRSFLYGLSFSAGLLVLGLTFSRSAWLGFSLSLASLLLLGVRNRRRWKMVYGGLTVLVGLALIAGLLFRHNASLQNALFHTEDKSTIAVSSNQGHKTALRNGLRDLVHEPLGRGPGTAGPASVYNHNQVRIAENYFVQVGQETGWFGFVLFLAIVVITGRMLWRQRTDPLALSLFISLIGLSFVNLLSHAWTDDTLAYLWWGLLGIALNARLQQPAAKVSKP